MPELKAALFAGYGGFADKRVKNLDKATTFQVDDRDQGTIGADKKPLSWFCQIHADARSDDQLVVRLFNAPVNDRIEKWAERNGAKLGHGIQPRLEFTIDRGKQALLSDLASQMKAIVAPGAPRYEWAHYKYACPRVARSLEKLKTILDSVWTPGSKGRPAAGPPLF